MNNYQIDYTKGFLTREPDYLDHLLRIKSDFRYFFYHIVWKNCTGNDFYYSRGFDYLSEHCMVFLSDEIMRMAIAIPPRNSKSLIFSIALPLWQWLQDPSDTIIAVSHHSMVLEAFQTDRKKILDDPEYIKMFGTDIIKNTSSIINNSKAGHILSFPIMNVRTGLGANRILIDDPISAGDCTVDNADKVWAKTTGALFSRSNNKKKPRICAISQRLADFDIVQRLIDIDFVPVTLQAIQQQPVIITFPSSKQTWERPVGDVLNPDYESLEVLERIRKDDPATFQSQYLQDPAVQGAGIFQWDDVGLYDKPRDRYDKIFISVDSAASNKASAAGWGILIAGSYYDNGKKKLDILNASSHKMDYVVGLTEIKRLIGVWKPDKVLIENKSTGQALIPTLKAEFNSIVSIEPKGSKEDRVLRSSGFYRDYRLRVPNTEMLPFTKPWMEQLKYELVSFPLGRTCDLVDALSQLINWYDNKGVDLAAFYGVKKKDDHIDHLSQYRLGGDLV